MATIYQKTVSDKTCILAPREFILRPFDFEAWTEMRVGIYLSGVASSGDNTDSASEHVTINTAADKIAFGIKDSATNDLPGLGAALFLGMLTSGSATRDSFCSGGAFITSSGTLSVGGYHDTTLVAGLDADAGAAMSYPASASGATGYCGFYGIRFVISNLGLSSQSLSISSVTNSPIAGTGYSAAALELLINNSTYSSARTVAWNDGAVARVIPDAFYLRMPFYSNRIRMSAMAAIRYAP